MKGQILYDFIYEIPRIVNFIETESRLVIPCDWEREEMESIV